MMPIAPQPVELPIEYEIVGIAAFRPGEGGATSLARGGTLVTCVLPPRSRSPISSKPTAALAADMAICVLGVAACARNAGDSLILAGKYLSKDVGATAPGN